ncbi:hypothetical protein [Nocardia sp. NPDC004415]
MIGGSDIRAVAVDGVVKRDAHISSNIFKVRRAGFQTALHFRQLPGDSILLLLEEIQRQCPGVVGLEQSGALIE